jgi:hypothetical protein
MKKSLEHYSTFSAANTVRLLTSVLITILLLIVFYSCNFNYPEEKQEQGYSTDLEFHFDLNTTSGIADFTLTEFGNEPYQVIVYPRWVDVKKLEGNLNNGYCSIPFSFKEVETYMQDGKVEGYIFVKVGKSEIFRITISYGNKEIEQPNEEGLPLYCSTAEIDFGIEDNRSFVIANPGQVDKNWYITDIPSWLTLSETSGNLPAGVSLTIYCSVNREGVYPGSYSQIINIESNNPQLSSGILMRIVVPEIGAPADSASVKWITGTVQDAYYNKVNDVLYILTKSPNNLLVKTADNDSLITYPLERIPNCIDVTADGKTLAIGYNQAYVDVLNAETLELIRQYETDCVPYDLVFGENGWCYLSPEEDQWVYLYCLNLTTGVTFRTSTANMYEKTILRKMPGKPLLYATRPSLSPSGLLIINIEKGVANDTIPAWHEDTGGIIWLSKDGSKIFGGDKEIHKTPEYTTETFHLDLPKTGTMDIPRGYLKSLDYNEKLKCYFAVGTDYWWGTENSETIFQVNEVSFSAEKMIKVAKYPGFINQIYNPVMDVHHVFSNSSGTKLYALKNVQRNLELNIWAMEILDLPLK